MGAAEVTAAGRAGPLAAFPVDTCKRGSHSFLSLSLPESSLEHDRVFSVFWFRPKVPRTNTLGATLLLRDGSGCVSVPGRRQLPRRPLEASHLRSGCSSHSQAFRG